MLVSYQNFFEFPELISFWVLNFLKNSKIHAIPECNLWIIIKDLKSSIVQHLALSKGHSFLISVLKGFNLIWRQSFLLASRYLVRWCVCTEITASSRKSPFVGLPTRSLSKLQRKGNPPVKFWKILNFCSYRLHFYSF